MEVEAVEAIFGFFRLFRLLNYLALSGLAKQLFRFIRLCSITPQHILHSRVKDSITHNSTVILCSNFNGRLVC